jgi:hypothetical protein
MAAVDVIVQRIRTVWTKRFRARPGAATPPHVVDELAARR